MRSIMQFALVGLFLCAGTAAAAEKDYFKEVEVSAGGVHGHKLDLAMTMGVPRPRNDANSVTIAVLPPLLAGSAHAEDRVFPQSATIPQTVAELWAGFPEFDKATPLEVEVLKAWEQDGVVCRLVRYQVGVFKGAPARIAAFYAFPKGATKLPALLQMHGGGQSASLDTVMTDAQRGYASLSINWGGNKLSFGRTKETYDGPQTDWASSMPRTRPSGTR